MINSLTERQSLMKIYCLGFFRIIGPHEETALGIMSKHKMWMLLKYLIVKKGLMVPTEEILATLWPEHQKPWDTAVLRTTICRLKTALNLKKSSTALNSLIIYRKGTCFFNTAYPCWLDFEEFEMLCHTAHGYGLGKRQEAMEIYKKALDLYQGDFLAEDPDVDWITPVREYYRRLYLNSTKELAGWLMEEGDYETARWYLEKALKTDPYAEDIVCSLIRVLWRMGKVQEAKERYSTFSAMLYNELGERPSRELRELYRAITKINGGHFPNEVTNLRADDRTSGPFLCDPDLFANYIMIEQRRVSRGETACISVIRRYEGEMLCRRLNDVQAITCKFFRKSDIISLIGPDHLAVLLPATDLDGGKTVLNHLKKQLKKMRVSVSGLQMTLQSIRSDGIFEEQAFYW